MNKRETAGQKLGRKIIKYSEEKAPWMKGINVVLRDEGKMESERFKVI